MTSKIKCCLIWAALASIACSCGTAPSQPLPTPIDLSGWTQPVQKAPKELPCTNPKYLCKGGWGPETPCCEPDQSS